MPDNVDIGGQSTIPVVSVADGRAVVRLNRPREHNRLEPADLGLLRDTFGRVDADPTIRVLILPGTGKSFSSGFHIGALADRLAGKGGAAEDRGTFERMVDRLRGGHGSGARLRFSHRRRRYALADAGGSARHRLL